MLSAVCCLLFIQALLLIPSNDVQKGNNIEHMFTILLNNSQSNEELNQLNLIFWWWSPNDLLVSWEYKMRKRLSFAAVLKLPFNFIYNNKLILETRFKSLHRTLRLSISQIRSWTFGGCEKMPFSILSPRILRYFLNFSEGHSVNSRWSGRLHPQVFE